MTEEQVTEVLHHLENSGLIRLVKPLGDWYRCYCPIHNSGNESRPSCGVALRDIYMDGKIKYPAGLVHCFTCGLSKKMPDAITEILNLHGITSSGLDWLKEHVPGFDGNDVNFDFLIPPEMTEELVNRYAINYIQSKLSELPKYISEAELASYRLTVPYMYERKLTDEVIAKYDVGFDANFIPPGKSKPVPCITFPIRDIYGNVPGFCRRSIKGKFFFMDPGVKKSVYGLYELPKRVKSVIITESCFNTLTCVVYGKPAVGLMGTGTPEEIEQIKMIGADEYVLWLDPDAAGERGMAKLKKALSRVAIVRKAGKIPPIKNEATGELISRDINNLSKEEFDYYYSQKL